MAIKDLTTLLRKLAEVGAEINAIPKAGRNEKQHYDYAKEADFKREVRAPFFKRGLVLIPDIIDRQNTDSATQSGGSFHFTDITVKFTIYDSETGESISGSVPGTGSDSLDKAVWKALAGAMKYFLAMTFLIPTGDDPEGDDDKSTNSQPPKPHQTHDVAPGAAQAGATILTFGKHIGKSLSQVYAEHPDYIKWLTGNKADGTPNSRDLQAIAKTFLAAQNTPAAPLTWSSFWLHMKEIGADKDFVNLRAAEFYKLDGPIEGIKELVKTQEDLEALDVFISEAMNERQPGDDFHRDTGY